MTVPPASTFSCALCNAPMESPTHNGICAECVEEVGSVVVVPASTVASIGSTQISAGIQPSFGDYEILSELAHGGMGVVYVARQVSLNRQVAMKMIKTRLARPEQIRRFQAEAEHAATLDHPNIVPVYDSGSIDGVPYFTMKLVKGRSLKEESRRLVLDARKGVQIMATIARAVHFAHQRGILHRDLKPANILIDDKGVPYVTDFGIAKRIGTEDGLTHEGAVMGTPNYMSPEQAGGVNSTLTTAADVYGLGAIFYEILTLRAPYHDSQPDEIIRKVKTEEPITPRMLRAGIHRDLETICMKCLEKAPEQRYASAEALSCDLERWLNNEPILARAHSPLERAIKWARRRPAVASGVAGSVLVASVVAGFYWHSQYLVQRAEFARIEERHKAADGAVAAGTKALQTARAAYEKNRDAESDNALMEAEDRFRNALVDQPENKAAVVGLRDAALLNFDASLRARNFRQAREKLLLAYTAKLSDSDFESKKSLLAKQESERGDHIRARVKWLMDDAAKSDRSVTHENAVYELIALKDPITSEILAGYAGHERPECRMLACAALEWIGDASVMPYLLLDTQPKTQNGDPNPVGVQEAAIKAVCGVAADDDLDAYRFIQKRINAVSYNQTSLLYQSVKKKFAEFSLRQAKFLAALPDDSARRRSQRATRLFHANAFQEALVLYEKLLEKEPSNLEYIVLRGLIRRELKDAAGALTDFDKIVALLPNQMEGYINRSNARHDLNDNAGALSDLNKALEFSPNDATLLSIRGTLHEALGDTVSAMEDYDRALKFNKNELFALTNRASTRARMKDLKGALADFDRALALSPMFRQALTGRGCTRMELNDTDGAISDFDKTLALDPTQWNCFYNRAVLKMGQKNYKDAIRDFDHAIGLQPDFGAAYYNRGLSKSRLNDPAGAAEDYQTAIERDPARVDAMINLGNLRAGESHFDEARRLLDRAIATDPKRLEGWKCRAELNFREKKFKPAASDLKTAISLLAPNAPSEKRSQFEAELQEYEAASK